MASMNAIADLLLTWLGYWATWMALSIALPLSIEALLEARDARRQRRELLQHIDAEAEQSVQRIGTAFRIAQRQIRDEARRAWRDRQ
ncbi:hypothetical protein [Mycobacteroides abscessus]|uniref:hypothetical protein n=1 Tax=Mycobacteroides abscessus TaxID=36809 RepID=UPI0009A7C008|nr:hypothetical protein [Mycobacteroides abscessus]RIT44600.1 hypothetical protein D2E80_19715 [Mycobacteroides abscessus]SKT78922.1 Uncharacterised protein [Mycobacteroides abscessus subsp. massiliense]SKU02945.1 Uncharacterised protein [Mycobacteroides abscessus subsp. massiliense]